MHKGAIRCTSNHIKDHAKQPSGTRSKSSCRLLNRCQLLLRLLKRVVPICIFTSWSLTMKKWCCVSRNNCLSHRTLEVSCFKTLIKPWRFISHTAAQSIWFVRHEYAYHERRRIFHALLAINSDAQVVLSSGGFEDRVPAMMANGLVDFQQNHT